MSVTTCEVSFKNSFKIDRNRSLYSHCWCELKYVQNRLLLCLWVSSQLEITAVRWVAFTRVHPQDVNFTLFRATNTGERYGKWLSTGLRLMRMVEKSMESCGRLKSTTGSAPVISPNLPAPKNRGVESCIAGLVCNKEAPCSEEDN